MCDGKPKLTLRDVILAGICYLQEKNGVTLCEIAEYISEKNGCDLKKILDQIRKVLSKAQLNDIINERKGQYRINEKYDDLPDINGNPKQSDSCGGGDVEISEDSDEEDCDEEQDEDKFNPCDCLKLSQDCITDDDEDDNRCPISKKKRKCGK